MGTVDKKAALAAYKERKTVAGVFAVRCTPTGQIWVGTAPDLGTIRNRLWFQLKMNGCPHRPLQAAWNEHGADSLVFEEVERMEEEALAFARNAALKARVRHWAEELKAAIL